VPINVKLKSDYFFLLGLCVRADPAAVLAAFDDFGFRKTLLAAEAAFFEVFSHFVISYTFNLLESHVLTHSNTNKLNFHLVSKEYLTCGGEIS